MKKLLIICTNILFVIEQTSGEHSIKIGAESVKFRNLNFQKLESAAKV